MMARPTMFVPMSAVQRAGLEVLTEGRGVEYQLVREKRRSAAVHLRIVE
jgi:cold shock CspA family protein